MDDWKKRYLRERDAEGYVPFNADRRLGQNQYASRYAEGEHGSPELGRGLRWKNLDRNYHELMIHEDDLEEFHRRVKAYEEDASYGRMREIDYYLN